MLRRTFIGGLIAAPAIAQGITRVRMATSWPKNLPGPGVAAANIAREITSQSGGKIEVQLFAAGELLPAFSVLEGVGNGTIEMGHSASFFNAGKEPACHFFTTVPGGLYQVTHTAWLQENGQKLWDDLYAGYGIKPFEGGNVGASYGGWFKKPVTDFKGLKIRAAGLGGELFNRLGATALAIPPGDIYGALERGVIDAAEFTAPVSDERLGLYKVAPHYYGQTFTKPNGSSEFLVNLKFYESLTPSLQRMIDRVCANELFENLMINNKNNEAALARLKELGTQFQWFFPRELVEKAKIETLSLREELLTRSTAARKIGEDYNAFQKKLG
jgi:TRAP-type mannitol/chloroaromatic compound transport system substrate-binding protein